MVIVRTVESMEILKMEWIDNQCRHQVSGKKKQERVEPGQTSRRDVNEQPEMLMSKVNLYQHFEIFEGQVQDRKRHIGDIFAPSVKGQRDLGSHEYKIVGDE